MPKSLLLLISALEEGDKDLEAEALRTMHPTLEVSSLREPKERSLQHVDLDPEEVRIFGFALPPRLTHALALRGAGAIGGGWRINGRKVSSGSWSPRCDPCALLLSHPPRSPAASAATTG